MTPTRPRSGSRRSRTRPFSTAASRMSQRPLLAAPMDLCEVKMLLSCCPKNSQDAAVLAALKAVQDAKKKLPTKTKYRDLFPSSGAQDTVGLHEDVVTCIEFSQMTGQVVTGSFDKKLRFWDTKTGSINSINTVKLESHVASLSICGMYLLAAVARNVYVYDIRNLSGPTKAKDCPLMYDIQCHQASPEWNGYVAGSVDGVVALKYFDRGKDGDTGYAFRCHPNSRDGKLDRVSINCVAIHPCKKILVTGDDKGYTISWDAQSKKKLLEHPTYSGSVSSMSYNCSGQLLAVAPNYYHEEDNKALEKHEIFIETVDYRGKSRLG